MLDSRKLPGKVTAGGRRRRQSEGLRPGRPLHAGAAIPLARRARTARRGGEVARALHVDHEHAAAALREAHPRPRLRGAEARLHRSDASGTISIPRCITLCSPDPQAIRPPDEQGQRAAGHAADQLQGARSSTTTRPPRSCASSRRTSTRCASIRGDGSKIELPVKLRVLRFDLRAARQMVDAARRQLPLRHQGRHAHRAGGGALRHRDLALGLQFRVRPVRQARRQAGRSRAVREIRRRRAEPDASGLGRARACRTARRTSSAPTSWCSSSPSRRA